MKYYQDKTVYEAALERIRFLYQEFDDVVVSFSGGKDSTVTLHMTLQVARELNRLPVKVVFLDQEAEWQTVIDYIRTVSQMPEVEMWWFQMPLKLFSSASSDSDWLQCWEEGKQWMRPREPNSIKVNRYNCDRFKELFKKISVTEWGEKRIAWVAGVRAEESPSRLIGLTQSATYKHVTWAQILDKGKEHFTFYPLYDWSYTDIWAAIHKNAWPYCKIYDEQYRYGMPTRQMRVSNLHHETSFVSLYYLQEIEKETWEKLCKRLPGVSTLGQLKDQAYACPEKLPFMFSSWREYRDHLIKYLIVNEKHQEKFRRKFASMDKKYEHFPDPDQMLRRQIKTVLTNDYHFTQLDNYLANPILDGWRKWMNGKWHEKQSVNPLVKLAISKGQQPTPLPKMTQKAA